MTPRAAVDAKAATIPNLYYNREAKRRAVSEDIVFTALTLADHSLALVERVLDAMEGRAV